MSLTWLIKLQYFRWPFWRHIAALFALAGLLVQPAFFGNMSAQAHLWYPKACCNDQDCFRANRIEHLPDGSMRMHTNHMSVIVPRFFMSFPSLDNDAHVCVYRDLRGRYHPRCVFLPGIS